MSKSYKEDSAIGNGPAPVDASCVERQDDQYLGFNFPCIDYDEMDLEDEISMQSDEDNYYGDQMLPRDSIGLARQRMVDEPNSFGSASSSRQGYIRMRRARPAESSASTNDKTPCSTQGERLPSMETRMASLAVTPFQQVSPCS
eukprot:CAMPEP_0194033138 /NCGR_PEP_ID=MMETSP0009_2-20130614/5926_1 /TAXON_ID=210454 /ORGANISM="Grammatophora oceanica, Strain CCMP 410" /LENGTH=143 /DNA_ID=CAMNT_0038673771 /DNA_START=37 /DNA_END=468 /DNA_ORIENTATION=-